MFVLINAEWFVVIAYVCVRVLVQFVSVAGFFVNLIGIMSFRHNHSHHHHGHSHNAALPQSHGCPSSTSHSHAAACSQHSHSDHPHSSHHSHGGSHAHSSQPPASPAVTHNTNMEGSLLSACLTVHDLLSVCLACFCLCLAAFVDIYLIISTVCSGLDGGGGHWLVRMEWRPAGWSVCLPLLISSYTIKSRSSLLAPAQPGGFGKRAVKR